VEVVFGQMKSNNKFNRFTMRGLEKVDIEFALMCIGHNLRKWSKKLLKTTSSGPDDQPKYNNPLTYGLHWINYPYEPMAA